MRIFRGFDEVGTIVNPVVTTGSFDGVHLGHKTILNRLRMLADKHRGESVLITFDPHPRKVLYPESAGKDLRLINSQEEKLMLLEKAGLDNVIIVHFTLEFSKITSEEFVREFLFRKLNAKVVVSGFNHHFGFNKEGDHRQLWGWQEKYGFEAEEIPEQEVHHETVSSTRIRKAVSEGYIQRANAYLDHYYIIMGSASECTLVLPPQPTPFFKVKLTDECKLLPSVGIYAVSVTVDDRVIKGMAVICSNGIPSPEVLFHTLDTENSLTGKEVILLFHKKIYGHIDVCHPDSARRITNARQEISDLIY
jgi:riboflavin kinase/FMN adenylyltransferase